MSNNNKKQISVRLKANLYQAFMDYLDNNDRLSQTQVVNDAISDYIGYKSDTKLSNIDLSKNLKTLTFFVDDLGIDVKEIENRENRFELSLIEVKARLNEIEKFIVYTLNELVEDKINTKIEYLEDKIKETEEEPDEKVNNVRKEISDVSGMKNRENQFEARVTKLENFISEHLDRLIDTKIQSSEGYLMDKIDELGTNFDDEIENIRCEIPDNYEIERDIEDIKFDLDTLSDRIGEIEGKIDEC